jgi:eukaryotic-like serine/threonine-protein kinase
MMTSDRAGSVLDGRFELEVECKRGGMGTIWKARDRQTAQPIALKILHGTGADQAERFVREGALLADLRSPNVVAYVGHGITSLGVPYLAMEWLDGETVSERLARQPLTLRESLTLVRSAARALAVVHRLGVVHRDIKPSNLFLRQREVDDVVLIDLGIARLLDVASDLTRTGSILGTPGYMAPEQAQGQQDLGPAADIFSLGCVLFECLTGDPPFVGAHLFSLLAKVLFEEAPRLRDRRPQMPEALDRLLAHMLTRDRGRRLPDADGLLAALDAIGPLADAAGPDGVVASSDPVHAAGAELELVSVILATQPPAVAGAPAVAEPELPDVVPFGAELKRLIDGTIVVTLAQRGGAATDLCARAARCALRLHQGRPGGNLVVATGRGLLSGRAYIGEAVDRAGLLLRARLASGSGAILLDEVTGGLLDARFSTARAEGELGAFVLEGEDPSIDPGRRLLGRPTTCVGRDHELGMLQLGLRACAEESSPRAVLVVGAPGIGKSRLRHELVRHAQTPGAELTLLQGLGDPMRTSSVRGLLGDALCRLAGIRSDAPWQQQRAALEERITQPLREDGHEDGHADRSLAVPVVVGFLAELCGLGDPDPTLPELRAARQNPGIMSDLMTQAWLTFLRAEAARRPVLLVLDDLQWSDRLSVDLVGAALRGLTSSALMVLALGRPEVLELFPDLWSPRLATMPLSPLGPSATARLVRQVLGSDISEASVQQMVSRAGGNALYLEELIRAAESRREAVPETVLAMLQARIGLLPAGPRRVLRAASVFGERFPVAGVEALLAATGGRDQLTSALGALSKHEVLEQQTDEQGGMRWRFRHALMCDAAYALWTAEELTAAHTVAARVLEDLGEDPTVIASHHVRGSHPQRAVRHYITAAEQALRRNDLGGVIALVDQALACGAAGQEKGVLRSLECLARFYQNDVAGSDAASKEALALLPRGHRLRVASLSMSTYTAMHLGRGVQAAAQIDELLATDPADDRAGYIRSMGDVLISHVVTGNRVQAGRILDRLVAVDAQDGGADPLAHGHRLYWQTRVLEMLGGDPHATWRAAVEGVACYKVSGDRRMLAYMIAEEGECARRLFSVTEGMAVLRQAVAAAHQIREPVTTSFVQQYLSTLLAEHGRDDQLAEARVMADEVVVLGGASIYRAFGLISLALISMREGNLAGAEAHAQEARAAMQKLGLRSYYQHVDATLVQVLLARGQAAAAAVVADATLVVMDEGPMGLLELPMRLHAARAHLGAGRGQDARRGVTRALAELDRRASLIPEAAMRARFLTAVPEHAALRVLGGELG